MSEISNAVNWTIRFKRNRVVLVAGILLALFGFWLNLQWFSERPAANIYIINMFPGGLLLFTWYLASSHQDKRWLYIAAGVLFTVLVSIYAAFINLAGAAFLAMITPNTDLAEYYELSSEFGDSELTRHFPVPIPENATNIRYESLPQFMQGGGHLQLRFNLPPSEIEELLMEYRGQAQYTFIGGARGDHQTEAGGVPTTNFYTNETDSLSFPDDYEILVLDAEPGGQPGHEWNHGYSYGVIISLERSEIIYWVEYW